MTISVDEQQDEIAAACRKFGIERLFVCKPSGGGTGKSRTKPMNHQLGDVRFKVLSMA